MNRSRLRTLLPAAAALAAALLSHHVTAQAVQGTLTQEGQPLAGIRVVLVDESGAARAESATDVTGAFTLNAPSTGRFRVRAEAPGRVPIVSPLMNLAQGQTREFRMVALPGSVGPVALAAAEPVRAVPVRGVTGTAREAPRSARLRDFYDRAQRGGGRYLTREDVERLKPASVGELLRGVPGVVVGGGGRGSIVAVSTRVPRTIVSDNYGNAGSVTTRTGAGPNVARPSPRPGQNDAADLAQTASDPAPKALESQMTECPVQFYIDGISVPLGTGESIEGHVNPQELEGVEVYVRASMVPPQYQRHRGECGVILLWTRERTGS